MNNYAIKIIHLFADDVEGINKTRWSFFPEAGKKDYFPPENDGEVILLNTNKRDKLQGWEYLKGNLLTFVFLQTGNYDEIADFIIKSKEISCELKFGERGLGETLVIEKQHENILEEITRRTHYNLTAENTFGMLEYYVVFGNKHIYVNHGDKSDLSQDNFALWEDYYSKELALLDAKLFAVAQKIKLFKGQKKVILEEKKEMDNHIGVILHKHLKREIENEKMVAEMEDTIVELSNIYGTVGANSLVIKNAQTVLEEDITDLEELINRLFNKNNNGFCNFLLANYQRKEKEFSLIDEQLTTSLRNAKAAIDVVRTKVELIRTKESQQVQVQMQGMMKQNLILAKEGLSLQVAAAFIEFIVINYYSLSIWKTLTDEEVFHHIPAWLKLLLIVSFAGTATLLTHLVAENIQEHGKVKNKIILSVLTMIGIFVTMVVISLNY